MDKILSISEAAQYLGVLPLTLRNWEKRGKLQSFRTVGGHRRYKQSELDKIVNAAQSQDKVKEFMQQLEKVRAYGTAADQNSVEMFIEALKQITKTQK